MGLNPRAWGDGFAQQIFDHFKKLEEMQNMQLNNQEIELLNESLDELQASIKEARQHTKMIGKIFGPATIINHGLSKAWEEIEKKEDKLFDSKLDRIAILKGKLTQMKQQSADQPTTDNNTSE